MAESPVSKLARLLGGVVLMQGRLGHQVLGQMLVLGASDVAVAGASVVVAATTRQRNAVAQVALRTAAPALAVHGLLRKQEERVERQAALLAERERTMERRIDRAVRKRERELEGERERLSTRLRSLEAAPSGPDTPAAGPRAATRPRVEPRPAARKAAATRQRKRKKRSRPRSNS